MLSKCEMCNVNHATKEELGLAWPGRQDQIGQLLTLVGRPTQPGSCFFVYGTPKTGKTGVVRFGKSALHSDVLHSSQQHAWQQPPDNLPSL
jgi:Cdc6-like AAA superfamily ATPase